MTGLPGFLGRHLRVRPQRCPWGTQGVAAAQENAGSRTGKGRAQLRNLREGRPARRRLQSTSLSPWYHAHFHLHRHRGDPYHTLKYSVCTVAPGRAAISRAQAHRQQDLPGLYRGQTRPAVAGQPCQASPQGASSPQSGDPYPHSPTSSETPQASDVSGACRGMWQHQPRPSPQVPP